MLTGKKTYILGAIVTILGALQNDPSFAALFASHSAAITSVIGVLIMVLRAVTVAPATPSAK